MTFISKSRQASRMASVSYDLVIYGATWMGINAAISGAMRGLRVAVVNEDSHIGGHSTSGLNLIDVIQTNQVGGYFWHQMQRMAKLEGVAVTGAPTLKARSSGTNTNSNYFAASYALPKQTTVKKVLMDDLAASGADVYLDCPIIGVTKAGTVLTGLETARGIVTGRYFMDCDYHGDLMAMAGCAYVVGREAAGVLSPTIFPGPNNPAGIGYGESMAGAQATAAGNTTTYLNSVSLLDGSGAPLYPLVPNPGLTAGQGDRRIQAYSYRAKLRLIANGAIPFYPPEGYNEADFTIYGRIATAQGWTLLSQVVALTPLNDGGIDLNANGRISNDLLNGSFDYPEATRAQRSVIAQRHRYHTSGLLYYCMTAAGMPAAIRTNAALYGYDNRYWADTGYLPPRMYIREGRRLLGQTVVTQNDILNKTAYADPIVVLSYELDCHAPNTFYNGPSQIVADGDYFVAAPAVKLFPLRAILPRAVDCTNLIVTATPSVSHVAWFDARMEISMTLMAEAGACLAFVAKRDAAASLQSVPYASLTPELNRQKALVA